MKIKLCQLQLRISIVLAIFMPLGNTYRGSILIMLIFLTLGHFRVCVILYYHSNSYGHRSMCMFCHQNIVLQLGHWLVVTHCQQQYLATCPLLQQWYVFTWLYVCSRLLYLQLQQTKMLIKIISLQLLILSATTITISMFVCYSYIHSYTVCSCFLQLQLTLETTMHLQ